MTAPATINFPSDKNKVLLNRNEQAQTQPHFILLPCLSYIKEVHKRKLNTAENNKHCPPAFGGVITVLLKTKDKQKQRLSNTRSSRCCFLNCVLITNLMVLLLFSREA